jgi:hypothetical protein
MAIENIEKRLILAHNPNIQNFFLTAKSQHKQTKEKKRKQRKGQNQVCPWLPKSTKLFS